MFNAGATVTGGVSGAKAVIDRIGGTTATGYLVLREIVGIFQSGELVTDDGTPAGSATTSAAPVNYQNDSGEAEYWWEDDQLNVRCRFYSMRAKVTVLTPGQFPDLQPFVILRPTATVNPIDYRIGSSMPGYTPASGQYQIFRSRCHFAPPKFFTLARSAKGHRNQTQGNAPVRVTP